MSDQMKVTNVNEIFIASVTTINYIDLRKYLGPKLSRGAKVFPKKTVFYLLSGIHHGDGGVIGHSDSSLNSQFQTLFKILSNFCGYLDCKECKSIRGKPCSSKLSVWKEMEYDFKIIPLDTIAHINNDLKDETFVLSERSEKDLMNLSKELTEQTRPSALIFASCHSLYSSITDILRSNGIIATMNISKDLGEVTDGKMYRLDDQQKKVMATVRNVRCLRKS